VCRAAPALPHWLTPHTGTSDFTAWLAAPACIALQQALGTARITAYNHGLAKAAAAMLLRAWGTRGVLGIAADGSTAGMVAIELPWPLAIDSGGNGGGCEQQPQVRLAVHGVVQQQQQQSQLQDVGGLPPTADDAGALNLALRTRHAIEVPVACIDGVLWVRISAQVYNHMADYERLRDVIGGMKAGAELKGGASGFARV
jgi:isopenicillin-N epimerase